MYNVIQYALLVGGFNLTPPKNMKVKWDYCSQLNAKMKKRSQPPTR